MSETEILLAENEERRSVVVPKGMEGWKAEARKALEQAESLKVVDNESYLAVGEVHKQWSLRFKALWDLLNPACQAAAALHSGVVADRDGVCNPFQEAAKIIKARLLNYEAEQKRLREIEQVRLEAEAKKKAEDEALALAAELEAAGLTEEAAAVVGAPAPAPVVVAPKFTSSIGLRGRRVYSAKVVDLGALKAASMAGRVPAQAIMANQKFLDEQARSLKEAMDWPGVEVVVKSV